MSVERLGPGRPRSEGCDRAIENAAMDLLVEEGFGRMTIEGIATRAGVGKATVYRRWSTKEDLLVHAVQRRCLEGSLPPNSGDARADIAAMLRLTLQRMRDQGEVMQSFAAEQRRHPELAAAFRSTFLEGRRAAMRRLIEAGIERGQLGPETDVDLATDVGAALLWHRLTVTGLPLDDDLPERIVAQFLPAPSEVRPAAAARRLTRPMGPGRSDRQ